MVNQPPPQGASFAFDNAAKALDEQMGRIESLDAKAGVLLAADGYLLGCSSQPTRCSFRLRVF